jgi:uncharacterized Rmd1/YagE family protein
MDTQTCIAYCLGNRFDYTVLGDYLSERSRTAQYRDVLQVERSNGLCFLFPYGVAVSWGLPTGELQQLLNEIQAFLIDPHAQPIVDEFSYAQGAAGLRVHGDHIELAQDSVLEKLSLSHAIAQSVKLSELESKVQQTIDETAHIPRSIATKGTTSLGRKAISRIRGQLYLVSSDINLHFDLLDTPEFFWEYPELQDGYMHMVNYLEVGNRIALLNQKLSIIHELFSMLADEQNHQHSSKLEWIIIWLIAIEILIFLIHDILGWL